MFSSIKISPSILSADLTALKDDISMIADAGADWVHIDVMDGHFVPNITMGVPIVRQLVEICDMPLDVHLMISNPLTQIPWFLAAGADIITFHIEAAEAAQVREAIGMVHDGGARVGLAIKPKTPADTVMPFIEDVDMVLVMSVEPGFSGQSFIEGSDLKVAQIVDMARSRGVSPLIQVDGGIGVKTSPSVCMAGADVLVCGNAVFASDDPGAAVSEIRAAAECSRNAAREAASDPA